MDSRTVGYIASLDFAGIGNIWVARTNKGLCRISLCDSKSSFLRALPHNIKWVENDSHFDRLFTDLEAYISGKPFHTKERIDISNGTPFQQRVWQAIAKIPWGETRSYAWLAKAIENPRAFRAAANACGANPMPIVIPCHRVVASDGRIGGFMGGIRLKEKLLSLEGIAPHRSR